MLYEDLKAQKEVAEAQGNRRFLSLVLEALCPKFEVSKMAQKENPSWLNSQEIKEGPDPENVPDTEDFLFARLQLLLFSSSVLYLQCLSPAPLLVFLLCYFLVFSVFPLSNCYSLLPQEHSRANPHLPCSLHLPAPRSLPVLFSFHK